MNAIAEYNASNALQRRFVFDSSGVTGQVIVQYEGTGITNRRFMSSDERGSVISLTDSSGALINLNRYDEYGKPQSSNAGRFQYTGQKWIGEAGLYDYKFRDYLPHLGIFAQPDLIGYRDSPNLYADVGNDPINYTDPLGMYWVCRLVNVIVGEGPGDQPTLRCYDNGIEFGPYGGLLGFWRGNIGNEGAEVGFDFDPDTGKAEEVIPKKTCTVNTPAGPVDTGTFGSEQFSGIPCHLHNPFNASYSREPYPGPRDNLAASGNASGYALVGTTTALWVVGHSGGQYSIGVLSGQSGSPQSILNTFQGKINQLLKSWNQQQPSGGGTNSSGGGESCGN